MTSYIPNGTIVRISSGYPCNGQICGVVENFMGTFYEVVILESYLFQPGEIHRVAEEYVSLSK